MRRLLVADELTMKKPRFFEFKINNYEIYKLEAKFNLILKK